tara:strand:+ start:64 stop:216 length:153 start_codon:yes stop_codon:yes gene_type:complete
MNGGAPQLRDSLLCNVITYQMNFDEERKVLVSNHSEERRQRAAILPGATG